MTNNNILIVLLILYIFLQICFVVRIVIWVFKYKKHYSLYEFLFEERIGDALSSLMLLISAMVACTVINNYFM